MHLRCAAASEDNHCQQTEQQPLSLTKSEFLICASHAHLHSTQPIPIACIQVRQPTERKVSQSAPPTLQWGPMTEGQMGRGLHKTSLENGESKCKPARMTHSLAADAIGTGSYIVNPDIGLTPLKRYRAHEE